MVDTCKRFEIGSGSVRSLSHLSVFVIQHLCRAVDATNTKHKIMTLYKIVLRIKTYVFVPWVRLYHSNRKQSFTFELEVEEGRVVIEGFVNEINNKGTNTTNKEIKSSCQRHTRYEQKNESARPH